MAKDQTVYICQNCGSESLKWQGKCFECGEFNSFQEQVRQTTKFRGSLVLPSSQNHKAIQLNDVSLKQQKIHATGITELDNVLSGGFVPGQVVLIGGEPGIGKSTLLLQVADKFKTLYVCGEESEYQVKMRADRLGINSGQISLWRGQEVSTILAQIDLQAENDLELVIVDSIQSVYLSDLNSAPGSISQVQNAANLLTQKAKGLGVVMVLVGQITKAGFIAGPKQFEHIVDTVLYLEGDKKDENRILRVVKNRFGSIDRVGILQMEERGMVESDLVKGKQERSSLNASGVVRSAMVEGNRPIIVEVQALNASSSFGNSRRVANGFSLNRLNMLLAVLEKRVKIRLSQYDIYVNVSGGFGTQDAGLDLPIMLAVASVVKNVSIRSEVAAIGEVGLLGDIKPAMFHDRRRKELERLGYPEIIDYKKYQDIKPCIDKLLRSAAS